MNGARFYLLDRHLLCRKFFAVVLSISFLISPFQVAIAQESAVPDAPAPESTPAQPPPPPPDFSIPGVDLTDGAGAAPSDPAVVAPDTAPDNAPTLAAPTGIAVPATADAAASPSDPKAPQIAPPQALTASFGGDNVPTVPSPTVLVRKLRLELTVQLVPGADTAARHSTGPQWDAARPLTEIQ